MPHRTQPVPGLRQFNTEIDWLLKSQNSRARSLFAEIRRTLRQFHLEGIHSESEIFNEAYRRGVELILRGSYIHCPNAWMRKTTFNVIREYSRTRKRFQFMEGEGLERLLVTEEAIEQDLEAVTWALQATFQVLDACDRYILEMRILGDCSWKEVELRLVELGEEPRNEAALRKRGQRIMQRIRSAYHEIRPRD